LKALPISKHSPAALKPPETVLPRDVMEEQILTIARKHLSPLELQNLQDNLRRADDKKIQEAYLYWVKKEREGKKYEIRYVKGVPVERSKRSWEVDEKKAAKHVTEDFNEWVKAPNRMDMPGVDTKKMKD
jgi:hypothetical protein